MTALNLIHCQPDPHKFVSWASRHGLVPPGGDLGYAFHAALSAVFGSLAPKPFYYRDERAGLLAYTAHSADAMREACALCAAPDLADALGLDAGPHSPGLNVRPFPAQWQAGRVLGFDVRVRPMRRSKDAGHKYGRERDAYKPPIEQEADADAPGREAVYIEWLDERLRWSGAASLVEARMTRFQLTPVIRRTQAGSDDGNKRQSRVINGPDAVFSGHLRVEDSDAFARLLMRGIGRHRAFGFGMLLLKPASIDA
ncbi:MULTISPECIES: type I-E CRISPR-associated protein Cas6/Cse3/CasE [unclassified Caballeronia]|uniref:type I-E CRISPR-associated protein Cas6/Cse3/CasE n=1 Tax=unclassified Caballeronia TaxID=2646786 RepID=UPI0028578579|nr:MULTISPECIES: type I-E CRISPR-associated protein Cas6/Cse3/CasE [unclassified Caballeronia]MDR5739027.1 type I-E CRISPR-associated protein Cas6/Cse3/CasE [Caballeronia sp. LZ016]MDR5807515.1 type I-E CRISPR-associated protein Cas6/Cse3/CasE [Caballeronia sp. LZ019]